MKNSFFYQPFVHRVRITYLCVLLLVIFSKRATAQRSYDWRTNIDLIVERADSLSLKSQRTFYVNKVIKVDKTFKNDRTVRETWYYTISDGKIPIFQIRYLIDSVEFNETYYLNNGNLVCWEQYESDYFSPYDEITWSRVLFFDNNTVKQHVTAGRHTYKDQEKNSTADAIEIFNTRYTELLRNLRLNGVRRL